MNKALLAALLLAAAPLFTPAIAQTTTQMRAPDQTNPQARADQRLQPSFAHRVERGPGAGEANTIPTPTLSTPMTKITQPPRVPSSDPIR